MNESLRIKILIRFLLIGFLSAGIIGFAGLTIGKKILSQESYKKLTAIREMKSNQIENYFQQVIDQLTTFSESRTVIDATLDLRKAYQEIQNQDSIIELTSFKLDSILLQNYQTQLDAFDSLGNKFQHTSWVKNLPSTRPSKELQYVYLYNDSLIKKLPSYSLEHEKYHSIINNYRERFGYYDIFLIDGKSGDVFYTVEKEIDFATNLKTGPHRNSGLARVYNKAVESNDNQVVIDDFYPYLPSNNAPASFVAFKINIPNQDFAVLVFQLPVDKINQIMTDNYHWKDVGLGNSGETYLVGSDYLIRNQSRFIIEDYDDYIKLIKSLGFSSKITSEIQRQKSTIGIQPIKTKGTIAALKGNSGTEIIKDYRGIDVLSSYKPIKFLELNWAIMSEIDRSEAFAPLTNFLESFIIWFFLLFIIIVFISLSVSNSISKPIKKLTDEAIYLANGNYNRKITTDRNDELGILSHSFEKMRISLVNIIDDLKNLNQSLEEKVQNRTLELKEKNDYINIIINNVADALIIINSRGVIEFFNKSAENMFLYSSDEIKGKNISTLMPQPHKSQHDNYLANYMRTGHGKVINSEREVTALKNGNIEFPARLMISKIETGDEIKFIGLVGDLTERKKNQEQIKTQAAALHSTSNGIVITSSTGTIQWVNPAFTKLTGYSLDDVIDQNHELLFSSAISKDEIENMWNQISTGNNWHKEIVNKKKNGDIYNEEVTITPVYNENDEINNFVSVKQDISERIKVEKLMLDAKNRMEEELNVAREIQMSMLPLTFPAFPKRNDIDIYAKLIPAREVGGDFFDLFFIDDNHFCFVVGDVSGKGVPAALMMAVTKTLIKSRSTNVYSTAEIIQTVNNELAKDNDANMFATVFIGILNTENGNLVYTNAGHNPSFIYSNNSDEIIQLSDLHGTIVGALPKIEYSESYTKLHKDDFIVVYTDGVTESQNTSKQFYSTERLKNFISQNKSTSMNKIIDNIVSDVKKFESGNEQADDITVLSMRYTNEVDPSLIKSKTIEIENEIDQIATVQSHFKHFALHNDISQSIINRINIVFDELLSNIIYYAYSDKEIHYLKIEILLNANILQIKISDDGLAFNPFKDNNPDVSSALEDRPIGGLGIHIVKKMVDSYYYDRVKKFNILKLEKKIN